MTLGPEGLVANHFPFIVDAEASPLGTLRAHMARANGQWKGLDGSGEALVIFQGPHQYITPSWYPAKAETGKVVPTWNYALVHVYGRPRIVEDPEWLLAPRLRAVRRQRGEQAGPVGRLRCPGGVRRRDAQGDRRR